MGDAGNERNELMELNGADIVVRCLADEGVEHVFGYPGGAVLYIYDAIYKQDKFQHILVRHEQAAVHAAEAYYRLTGKLGVAAVTAGPGVTDAITGVANAWYSGAPVLLLGGRQLRVPPGNLRDVRGPVDGQARQLLGGDGDRGLGLRRRANDGATRAASPTPSAKPGSPLPATVVTWPCGDTRRTLWLPLSHTSTLPPR